VSVLTQKKLLDQASSLTLHERKKHSPSQKQSRSARAACHRPYGKCVWIETRRERGEKRDRRQGLWAKGEDTCQCLRVTSTISIDLNPGKKVGPCRPFALSHFNTLEGRSKGEPFTGREPGNRRDRGYAHKFLTASMKHRSIRCIINIMCMMAIR
jgi:hypothetical protein